METNAFDRTAESSYFCLERATCWLCDWLIKNANVIFAHLKINLWIVCFGTESGAPPKRGRSACLHPPGSDRYPLQLPGKMRKSKLLFPLQPSDTHRRMQDNSQSATQLAYTQKETGCEAKKLQCLVSLSQDAGVREMSGRNCACAAKRGQKSPNNWIYDQL